jgi:hypothetical protein
MAIQSEDSERIVKFIADSLEQGKDFVINQAPSVAQEIYWRGIIRNGSYLLVALILGAIVLGVSFYLCKRYNKYNSLLSAEEKRNNPPPWIIWLVAFIIPNACALWIFICNTCNLMVIIIAPKVYILEEVRKLL